MSVPISRLLNELLREREKIILQELSKNVFRSANQLVKKISKKYNIPESSVWFSLRKLRRLKLIEYGGYIVLTEDGESIIMLLKH